MATKWYGKAAQSVGLKKIDLVSDDVKVMLVSSSYTPNQDTHAVKADVTNEVTGTGYTAGGKGLSGKSLTQNTSTNRWKWDADDLAWTATTLTFRYAVLYDNTHADKPLIGYVDFESNQTTSAQDLTIKWEGSFQDEITGDVTTSTGILEFGY